MTIIGKTNIEPLIKAFKKFEEFRVNDKTEQERAGTIQAFEYCFELAWKTMKRLLAERGVTTNSPRETLRAAAAEKFIFNLESWFDFLEKRNITVHTYNIEEAQKVIDICENFSIEVKKFFQQIQVQL